MFSPYRKVCSQYLSENPKEDNHLGDLGDDGGTLYVYRTETRCDGVVWTHADSWRAFVNTVMNCLTYAVNQHMLMLQHILLTFWRRNYFLKFSTPCI